MEKRLIGKTNLQVTPIGYGAFKIGRNQKIKYAQPYDLPTEAEVKTLLNQILDLGINYIDTAPAYGLSEQRIGQSIADRRSEYVLSTKVGETFEDGQSTYDFSAQAITASIERSLKRLQTDILDLVFIHSDGNDLDILNNTDVVPTLIDLKQAGKIQYIGMSGKYPQGASAAMTWADALMVEYHLEDQSHAQVIEQAAAKGIGIIVKKGLASGQLPPQQALQFIAANPHIASTVIGGLNPTHIKSNIEHMKTTG